MNITDWKMAVITIRYDTIEEFNVDSKADISPTIVL